MSFKPSDALRFLGALGAAGGLLLLLAVRVTSCAPAPKPAPPVPVGAQCDAPGWAAQARANADSLHALAWAPYRRPETGWEIYAPLIAREIGAACPPGSPSFAAAFARWQASQGRAATGVVNADDFQYMRGVFGGRRPIAVLGARGVCPDPTAAALEANRPGEGYGGKQVFLRPAAFAAYRRMVAAARAESAEIRADPRNLTIFSGYRSPTQDAERCRREGGCDGVSRAVSCSPHRTGLAVDMYVGEAPGHRPDSTADPNRLYMTKTATYRWLVANADRFGFAPYPFEPWHWEWTGESP